MFDEFAKEVKHLLSAWETQTKLLEKYKRLEDEGALHSHFKAEADFKWQFTKLYLAKAVPLDVDDMNDGQFSVADSWAAMRTRHAKECFQFVLQHQGQCVKLYDELIASSSLQQLLADRLDAWFAQHNYADEEIRHALKHRAVQYVESLLRVERPRVQSRMVKGREQQQKREQALLEARSKWEEMDVKDVLSPALFELKQLDARQKRPTKIKDDSALAFLVKDNAELCQKHKLKIVPASSSGHSQATPHKREPTPKGRARKPRSPSPAPSTPRSILKSPARSPRSQSRNRSTSSKRVRFEQKGQPGKGKGKGKGKGSSKGKGNGKNKSKGK